MSTPDATEVRLLEIVEAIRALTPSSVDACWDGYVYSACGILRSTFRIKTASVLRRRWASIHTFAAPPAEISAVPKPTEPIEDKPAAPTEPAEPATGTEREYRSAVSGRVVIAGENGSQVGARTAMAPLPGLAPEEPIGIIFDGGTRGDPALGYGSYAIRWPGLPQQVVRLRFADDVTGDEAEYDTLIAALEATLQRLQDNDAAPESAKLDIRGDSHSVLSQVRGDIAIDGPALQLRCDRVRFLLRRFGSWTLSRHHHDRSADAPSG